MPHRYSEIRLSMFAKPGDFPKLKGKAAEIRHLAGPLEYAFRQFMDRACLQHKQVLLMLQLAIKMESILDANKDEYRLPADAAAEWKKSAHGFVQLTTALAHHFHGGGILLFHFTIKSHYLLHLALLASETNPRLAWCYSGEDLMHLVRVMFGGSHRGAPPHVAVNKVMKKYAQAVGMMLMHRMWRR